jgi:hypothetical protein
VAQTIAKFRNLAVSRFVGGFEARLQICDFLGEMRNGLLCRLVFFHCRNVDCRRFGEPAGCRSADHGTEGCSDSH